MSAPPNYEVRFGTESDAAFLGEGILESERDLHGIGIWDLYLSLPSSPDRDSLLRSVLSDVALTSPESCAYNFRRFAIAATSPTAPGVSSVPGSCGCGFVYPSSSLLGTMPLLGAAMSRSHGWSPEDVAAAAGRLAFVAGAFAADVDFEGRWMIEGVYTAPEHRRRGLARLVVQRLIDRGREMGCKECLISCSVGNVPARTLYEGMGFKQVGATPGSEECMAKLHCAGFFMLSILY